MERQHHQWLAQHSARYMVPSSFRPITVGEDDKLAGVLDTLKANNISSAVVVSPEDWKKPIGIIDILDIVASAVAMFEGTEIDDAEKLEMSREWRKMPIGTLTDFSGRSRLIPVHTDAPLLYVLGALSRPSVHRVPVTDSDGNVVGVLTQSRVISYLHQNVSLFSDEVREKPVRKWMPPRVVQKVRVDVKVIDAFRQIIAGMVTGLAVLDKEDKLVGNISANDFKRLDMNRMFEEMHMPLGEFMLSHSLPKAITVGLDDSLEAVLATLAKKKVHRVFVELNGKAIGVISLCDIIDLISRPF